ncbi:MAG TPA: hypothetical protein VJY35_01745, partial [Candidatus Eisenbacteria bacterium]|nr:hypothetical protein [Candidatus Eisenbacteria bacterium]
MPRRRHPGDAVSAPVRPAVPSGATVARPHDRLLGNGRFLTVLTGAGTGGAWLEGQALTPWRGDPVEDADGWFVYLHDLTDGSFWSVGERPVPAVPDAYATRSGPGWMEIERRQAGIESRMEAWVDPGLGAECRVITLRNTSGRGRRIGLTSSMEVVLQDARRHEAHPGFSKLFVQTEWVPEHGLLLAHRRPRSSDDRHPWIAHASRGPGSVSHTTDRREFIGRGRGPDAPFRVGIDPKLSGTSGDVLDPILALQHVVELARGASVRIDLVLATGWDRTEALETARRLGAGEALDRSRRAAVDAARA